MKTKIFALFIAFGLVLNFVGTTFADVKKNKNKKRSNELVLLLPASDGVVSLDSKRFFASALPQILSGNKAMLDEVYAKIEEFKANTGIDIRKFDQMAMGITAKEISAEKTDYETITLARGTYGADSLAKLVKFASGDKFREETIGGRTVYVFSAKDLIEKNKPSSQNGQIQKVLNMLLPGISGEMAITAYDNRTLAFGTPEKVRTLLTDSSSRVSADLYNLVSRQPNAIGAFAMNMPKGMSSFIELGDDELGQNIDSIRQMFGYMDVVGVNTMLSVTAKTTDAKRAEGLHTNLLALRDVGKMILGSSKREDQKMYARLLENAKLTRNGTEVSLNLQVPQNDINILIGAK